MDLLEGLFEYVGLIAVKISEWKVTRQVRLRMGKSLGRKPADLELASLKTWMKVKEREQEEKESGAIHPR